MAGVVGGAESSCFEFTYISVRFAHMLGLIFCVVMNRVKSNKRPTEKREAEMVAPKQSFIPSKDLGVIPKFEVECVCNADS